MDRSVVAATGDPVWCDLRLNPGVVCANYLKNLNTGLSEARRKPCLFYLWREVRVRGCPTLVAVSSRQGWDESSPPSQLLFLLLPGAHVSLFETWMGCLNSQRSPNQPICSVVSRVGPGFSPDLRAHTKTNFLSAEGRSGGVAGTSDLLIYRRFLSLFLALPSPVLSNLLTPPI